MKPCCVPGCSDKVAKRFAIPSEKRIRDIWLQRINNDNLIYLNYSRLKHYRVCKNHFLSVCCDDAGKLRRYSLPTLYLPDFTEPSEQNSFSYSPQQQTFVTPENIKEILKVLDGILKQLWFDSSIVLEHPEHKLKTSEHRESEEIDTLGIELLPTTSPPEFVTIVTKRKVSFPVGSPKRNSVLQIGSVMRRKHINNILRGKDIRRANSDSLTSLAFIKYQKRLKCRSK
ncbi:hypothetical protein FQA39_LY07684 [Lamprigera yunnana]|nr:hypothetical protein FQA39_LY07684 [Lamprigera yunnana]